MQDTKKLVDELASILNSPFSSKDGWRRIRLCVTPEEYKSIREHMLLTYGTFHAKILGVPLQIEPGYERPTHEITYER